MTKDFYQILGVEKTATPEEIKNAYRKLALKWHPDKFATKSLEERKQANEKMRELNNAFEILGDEDKRRRFDNGETNFSDHDLDDLMEREKAKFEAEEERLQGQIRINEELLGAWKEKQKILEELWLLNAKHLDRSMTETDIGAAFCFTLPRVYEEDLDPTLWQSYKHWYTKVWEMPITIIRGEKEESEELKNFKKEMIRAIKETETALKIRAENKKKEEEDREKQGQQDRVKSQLDQARTRTFGYIEKELNEKNLKNQDLGEYANYQTQINNLDKVYKIRNLQEKILDHIFGLKKRNPEPNPNPERPDNPPPQPKDNPIPNPEQPDQPQEQPKPEDEKVGEVLNNFRTHKYDNLTQSELIKKIEKEQLNNASLQKLVSQLEIKVQELQEEIRELKAELPQTKKIREEIQKRETQLKQTQTVLNTISNNNNNNNNNNPWPMPVIIGGGIGIVALFGLITLVFIKKKDKKNH